MPFIALDKIKRALDANAVGLICILVLSFTRKYLEKEENSHLREPLERVNSTQLASLRECVFAENLVVLFWGLDMCVAVGASVCEWKGDRSRLICLSGN